MKVPPRIFTSISGEQSWGSILRSSASTVIASETALEGFQPVRCETCLYSTHSFLVMQNGIYMVGTFITKAPVVENKTLQQTAPEVPSSETPWPSKHCTSTWAAAASDWQFAARLRCPKPRHVGSYGECYRQGKFQ